MAAFRLLERDRSQRTSSLRGEGGLEKRMGHYFLYYLLKILTEKRTKGGGGSKVSNLRGRPL